MHSDVESLYGDVAAVLHTTRDKVLAHLDRGLRRMVLTLSALMIGAGAVVVLVVRSAS
jgi:hypothetical protein